MSVPARVHRVAVALGAVAWGALLLAQTGCSSDEAPRRQPTARPTARVPAPQPPTGTTDSGSRYLEVTAPIGALTAETAPVTGRMLDGPLPPPPPPPPPRLPAPPSAPAADEEAPPGDAPAASGFLPAPPIPAPEVRPRRSR